MILNNFKHNAISNCQLYKMIIGKLNYKDFQNLSIKLGVYFYFAWVITVKKL